MVWAVFRSQSLLHLLHTSALSLSLSLSLFREMGLDDDALLLAGDRASKSYSGSLGFDAIVQPSKALDAAEQEDLPDEEELVPPLRLLALCSWTIGVNFGFAAAFVLGTPLFVSLGFVNHCAERASDRAIERGIG